VPLAKPYGLAAAFTKVKQLSAADFTASNRYNIDYVGRMKRENTLDSLVGDKPPYGECLIDTATLAGNHDTAEYLNTGFVAFLDPAMHFDIVANLKVRHLRLQALAFNSI
jgi:hypothetical protein